jgi:uncharacterized alpha-E superfamily protein
MLARIAEQLFWLGRSLARAEHTARMLDGIFHVNLQARAEDQPGAPISLDALLEAMGVQRPDAAPAPAADEVMRQLTLDSATPTSVRSCVGAARERARTVRDAISMEMWEAVNGFYLRLAESDMAMQLASAPYAVYQLVKERCALVWGLADETMLRDEAHAFLMAGARLESADMVSRMLLMALPENGASDASQRAVAQADGPALALLHAVGAFQAYRRVGRAPATVVHVAGFLLFRRDYPESVAASLIELRGLLAGTDVEGQDCSAVLQLERLSADLELRHRASGASDLPETVELVQGELAQLDRDMELRYFAGGERGRTVGA